MASPVPAPVIAPLEAAPPRAQPPIPALLRWLVPSFADLVFLVLISILTFSHVGLQLFNDADTGWHIRNGEHILRTASVPRVDSFSYTMAGKPWFAWEWLYDALLGGAHIAAGLLGVRVLSAALIALTFALLYRLLAQRSGNALVSIFLTVLAAAAAQIHMLARPHVVTWLFTLLFLGVLYGLRQGRRTRLLWLPLLMLFWVNSHGGFILGPALIAIFLTAEAWQRAGAAWPAAGARSRNLRWLAASGLLCGLATLATPYGYKLHLHVFHYLHSRYIMDHVMEFQSPDFHQMAARYFECLLLLAVAALAVGRRKAQTVDLGLVLFAIYLGLYSARNLPISAILITAAIAPVLSSLLEEGSTRTGIPNLVRRSAAGLHAASARMNAVQEQLRGHAVPVLLLLLTCAAAWNGGRLAGRRLITASFNEDRFPVRATDKIAALGIRRNLFTTDNWGAYLIYRLYPSLHVFADDRHDFYGERFLAEFVKAADARPGWQQVFSQFHVDWVLIAPQAPLSAVLEESPGWRIVYADQTAVLFRRAGASRTGY